MTVDTEGARPTIAEAIAAARSRLDTVTDTSGLDAELLLAAVTGLGRAAIMAHPERELGDDEFARFNADVARRSRGEPLAYVVGHREFHSLDLLVGPAVLVPRPETELLVEAALARLPRGAARVLDLGTGSGAVALAMKHQHPGLDVTGVDCDPSALEIARANGDRLSLPVRWLESNWLSAVAGETFDLIVSNPPYVRSRDPHFDQALAFEPRLALDGGEDGLDAYREIFGGAAGRLAPGAWLVLEHGFDQRDAVVDLAESGGFRAEAVIDDLSGQPRVACFRESGP